MQAYLFIFLGSQAIVFILKCLTAKIFILKNCQPPLPESTVGPLTKKKGPFPNSTDCHTKHIAMLHGLWPSNINTYSISIEEKQNKYIHASSKNHPTFVMCSFSIKIIFLYMYLYILFHHVISTQVLSVPINNIHMYI